MTTQRTLLVCVVLFSSLTPVQAVTQNRGSRDRGSWEKTLHDKAAYFNQQTAQRHNILGSYPSSVRLLPPRHYVSLPSLPTQAGLQQGAWPQIVETGQLPPGWTFDHGTTGWSNVVHTSSWTGCLLTGQAFQIAFLRDSIGTDDPQFQAAYQRADEIIHSLRILTLVSGQPGYLARGVALGHGVSYAERGFRTDNDLWAQGVGEYQHLRYRGGPSHHNYDQVFRGLGIYYLIAADKRQQKSIREIVTDMSQWAHLSHDMVVMHTDGKRESTVLIGGWRGMGGTDRPSGGSLMALTGLKVAHHITGNPQVATLYDRWIERLGFRDEEKTKTSIMGKARDNYDDTDHLVGDLYLLNQLEKDPQLRAYYHKCVKDSWEVHQDEKMSWYNYVYRVILGDSFGDSEGSLWHLQTFPTCRVFQPQMNSIRTDLEFTESPRGKESQYPLPVYARPFDNEYHWKGSPYRLDGWTSRIVSLWEISPHDSYLQFAADSSGVTYWSNTRGEVWHAIDGLHNVRDFLFSPDYPWVSFAAGSGGIHRSVDGGRSWSQAFAQPVDSLQLDPENSRILYAVGPGGISKSDDLAGPGIGTKWRSVSGIRPDGDIAYAVDPRGELATFYRLTRQAFYTKKENDSEWTSSPLPVRIRGFSEVDPIGGRPLWLRTDPHLPNRLFRAVEVRGRDTSGPLISVSKDRGRTWLPIVGELAPLIEWSQGTGQSRTISREKLFRLWQRLRDFRITELRVDRADSSIWYGLMTNGIAVTHDAGQTWTEGNTGLDIPRPKSLWVPRHMAAVMVGTPAGMYLSENQAASWHDTSLILQGRGAIRSEIGGAGYMTAYWMGRYHGFITESQAQEKWWETK
ncbi:MAG: hypothetical protein ABGX16_08715 [Pirellulales bacterium]